eukprot:3228309-Pleurochrysis_carterae.AAC.1
MSGVEPIKYVLKKPCPDDIWLGDFLRAIGNELDKLDQCMDLCAWLKKNCSAADVGVWKETCTA